MVSVATVHVGGVHKGGDGVVLLAFTDKILSQFQNFELADLNELQPLLADWSGPDQVHASGSEVDPGIEPGMKINLQGKIMQSE